MDDQGRRVAVRAVEDEPEVLAAPGRRRDTAADEPVDEVLRTGEMTAGDAGAEDLGTGDGCLLYTSRCV